MSTVYGYGYRTSPYNYVPPAAANGSIVDGMAQYYHVRMSSSSMAGLPQDTFHRSQQLTSTRYTQPVSEWKLFAKDLSNLASTFGTIASIVGIFYPPALAVTAITSPYTSAIGVAGGLVDTTPKAVVASSSTRYNPWFR